MKHIEATMHKKEIIVNALSGQNLISYSQFDATTRERIPESD